MEKSIHFFVKKNNLLIIFIAITFFITLQSFLRGPQSFGTGIKYTHYNNYNTFTYSYFHLIQDKDLYQLYPEEHWDYFKYSPSFALFMGLFAHFPDSVGLFLWNLLNVLLLFYALRQVPFPDDKMRLLALAFILIELITSVQNAQSNGIITGLLIFAFIFLEKKRVIPASLLIVLTVFIKIFGLAAMALYLFYPNKIKAVLYSLFWAIILALLPLAVVSPSQLIFLYQSWFHLLLNDHSASLGLSVAGWLHTWFNAGISKDLLVLIGAILLFTPLAVNYRSHRHYLFRLYYLSSILIWVVIFNHKAESPTFVIAISGAALWYFSGKRKIEDTVLIISALIFTVLSPTDVFPRFLRDAYVKPYVLKAVPCILIWIKITLDLLFFRSGNTDLPESG